MGILVKALSQIMQSEHAKRNFRTPLLGLGVCGTWEGRGASEVFTRSVLVDILVEMAECASGHFSKQSCRGCSREAVTAGQCRAPVSFPSTASGTAFVEHYKVHFGFPGKCI